jgi:hypothetical protein
MRAGLRERLTFSNVISVIALFIALGGVGAYAADKLGSKDIAKNAIKSKHIKADAATGEDVDESSLGRVPRATRANSAQFADTAGDAETLAGFTPDDFLVEDEFQFGNGFDAAGAGALELDQEGAYLAFDGDIVIGCDDTNPIVRWDDFPGDDFVSDVWINGTHETVEDGDSSAETSLAPDDTATVHAWGGADSVALVHASVSWLPVEEVCVVNFTGQENFNSAEAAAAAAAGDGRPGVGTTRGLSDR